MADRLPIKRYPNTGDPTGLKEFETGDTLAVAQGGTGAVNAATGLSNLGGQPVNANLTSISALGTALDRMLYTTGVNVWAQAVITALGRQLVAGANVTSMQTTLGISAYIRGLLDAADANTAKVYLDIITGATGAIKVPVGTTAQAPTPLKGYIRYDDTLSRYVGGDGTDYKSLGGATGGGSDAVFYVHGNKVNNDFTLETDNNAISAGPIEVDDAATVTIEDGASWVIVGDVV